MTNLAIRLQNVPYSYFEFVDSVLAYAKIKPSHFELIVNYLDHNPSATSSDVIYLISSQPDFFDDDIKEDLPVCVG